MTLTDMPINATVAPDLDGCWYPFTAVFKANLYKAHGIDMPTPRTWDFYREFGWDGRQFVDEMKRQILEERLFDSAPPLPTAVTSAYALRDAGLHVVIQTARVYDGVETEAVEQTLTWLDRHAIPYDELIVHETKGATTYAFDDSPVQVQKYRQSGTNVVIIDQPWNRHVTGLRAANTLEAAEMIVAMHEESK